MNLTALIVTGLAFVAVLVAGITIVATPYDFANLPYFEQTQCTPVAVTVVKMPLCDVVSDEFGTEYYDEYVAIWKCNETGASILENPFSGNRQESIAQNNANNYPLNIIQNVSCNSKNLPIAYPGWKNFFQCQVWNTCFFDTDMIEDLQINSQDRYNRGFHLLYASIPLFVALVVFFIIFSSIICECCKKSQYI
jgi:hypothetical protein